MRFYCQHVERDGRGLFDLACQQDIEGIVEKWKRGPYRAGREKTTWFTIRNCAYTHWEGRDKMFERRGGCY